MIRRNPLNARSGRLSAPARRLLAQWEEAGRQRVNYLDVARPTFEDLVEICRPVTPKQGEPK